MNHSDAERLISAMNTIARDMDDLTEAINALMAVMLGLKIELAKGRENEDDKG